MHAIRGKSKRNVKRQKNLKIYNQQVYIFHDGACYGDYFVSSE